jgi:hypothetical protein
MGDVSQRKPLKNARENENRDGRTDGEEKRRRIDVTIS